MTGEIELDLNDSTPAKKSKVTKPTLAETLYAQRLVAGQHPEVLQDDKTITEGVKAAMLEVVSTPQVEKVEAALTNDRDVVNQLLGQIQMANSFARFADVVSLQKLKHIKETKMYRASAGMSFTSVNGDVIADVGTWSGFCNALGLSSSKVDEDLLNLKVFGEEALKQLANIGAGYRELRQYRKLPADEQAALIEAAKSGDKDQILELAESLIEKHIKEKAELAEKTTELEQDLKDTGKRINNMNAEIERLEMVNERLSQKKEHLTKFEPYTEDVRDECMHLQAGCEFNLASLDKLFNQVFYAENTPEQQLRIEQVYIAVSVAASNAILLLETMRELMPEMPDRVQGQHILTPAEAERWLHDYPMIENKHNAEQAAREFKREEAKPKGRGRPAGSKNKSED